MVQLYAGTTSTLGHKDPLTMSRTRSHYDNLKVARDAPAEVIKSAYRALANKYHPDRNPGCEKSATAMKAINVSYDVLIDPDKRRAHDAWIDQQSGPQASSPPRQEYRPQPPPSYTPPPTTTRAPEPTTLSEALGCLFWIGMLLLAGNWIFTSCGKPKPPPPTYSVPVATPKPTPLPSLRSPLFDTFGRLRPTRFTPPAFNEPELEFPPHGSAVHLTRMEAVAPFSVETRAGRNYLLKLTDPQTGRDAAKLYIVGGREVEFLVPLGTYDVKFATGEKWYGEKHLFGRSTQYAKFDELMNFTSVISKEDSIKLSRLRSKLDAANAAVKDFLVRNKFNQRWIQFIFNYRDPKTNVIGIDRLDSDWWKNQMLAKIKNPRVYNALVKRLNARLDIARDYYALLSKGEKIKGVSLTMFDVTGGNVREQSIGSEDFSGPQPESSTQL